jgi:hypothetical protein
LSKTQSRAHATIPEVAKGNSPEMEKTRADLEQVRLRLRAAKAKADELTSALAIAPAEELKSYGRLEELAAKGVELANTVREQTEAIRAAALEGRQVSGNLVIKDLPGLIVNSEIVGKLESNPDRIAELHAHALRQMLGLDEATSLRVREALAPEFERLRAQGLDRMQRPTEDQEDWYARRDQMMLDAAARVEALIPAENRSPNAVVRIMNLSTGVRTRMMRISNAPSGHMQLLYQEPGSEPIPLEAK